MGPLAPLRLAAAIAILAIGLDCAAASCLDVRGAQRLELSGQLTYRVFPGPPNYADVKAGDAPEPAFILALPKPVCFGEGEKEVSTIELLPTEKTVAFMRALVNAEVLVTLAKPIAATTPHPHAPLAAAVAGVAKLEGAAPQNLSSAAQDSNAATVVRDFYQSLGQGDGERAATYIAPEVRRGPLSAAEMTRFYGQLREPLRLTEIKPVNANRYFVAYTFKAASRACIGRALVDTVNRSGENYISYINALDGC
jgi:hypothetical protein